MNLLKAIRPINMLVIIITMMVLHFVAYQLLKGVGGLNLSNTNFALLTLSMVCIAGAGNLINDYYDKKVDAINQPEKPNIPGKTLLIGYTTLNIIGLVCAGIITKGDPIFFVFVMVITLLWAYSSYLQKWPLIGNIVVSGMVALVPLLLTAFENVQIITKGPLSLIKAHHMIILIYLAYALLSFTSNMAREIVKDVEDYDGDSMSGYKTFPILAGITASKVIATLLIFATIIVFKLLLSEILAPKQAINWLIGGVVVVIPLIISLIKLYKAQDQKGFHDSQTWIKISMLGSLVFLFIFAITI